MTAGSSTCTSCSPGTYQNASKGSFTIQASATLRLSNQNGAGCGRVEVLYQGQWGTVCNDDWDIADATVVCRQLGRGFSSLSDISVHGQGSGKIWMDNVACAGSEASLESCSRNSWGDHNCGHEEDAGACCSGSYSSSSSGECLSRMDSLCIKGQGSVLELEPLQC